MGSRYHSRRRRDRPVVAPTFDDGPNPSRADEVLTVLAAHRVRATAFMIGKWVERFPGTRERIVAAGHVIGNRSHLHLRESGDCDRAEAAIASVRGRAAAFLRIHHLDNFSVARQSPFAMSARLSIIYADVHPADYEQTDAEAIVQGGLDSPRLSAGSIVDLHDGSETDDDAARRARPVPMIDGLPRIIDGVRARGLEPVGLDERVLGQPSSWPPEARP